MRRVSSGSEEGRAWWYHVRGLSTKRSVKVPWEGIDCHGRRESTTGGMEYQERGWSTIGWVRVPWDGDLNTMVEVPLYSCCNPNPEADFKETGLPWTLWKRRVPSTTIMDMVPSTTIMDMVPSTT